MTSNPSKKILEELKKINRQEWNLIVSRPGTPPLNFSGGLSSYHKVNKVLDTDWTINNMKWQDFQLFISEADKNKILNFLKEKYNSDKKTIFALLEQGEERCNALMNEVTQYEENYYDYFKKIFEIKDLTGLYFRIVLNLEILLQELFPEIDFLPPLKLNNILKFHNELVKLSKIGDRKELNVKAKDVLNKYSWLTIFHYTGEYLTLEDILEKVEVLKKEKAELKKVLPPPEDFELKIYRYVTFLRTHLAETYIYCSAKEKPVLEKAAQMLGISYKEITYLTFEELLESLKINKLTVPKKEILSRQKRFGMFLYNKKVYILNEDECNYVFDKEKIVEEEIKELHGTSACRGKITGKVCIIKNVLHFSKFRPNDILVTHSTTPNFIMLMHLAKAFLTQEGGMTSHAAIIAREMQKPCIVGIKNLIKTLKDGDLVEVDADKGVVKVLKRK